MSREGDNINQTNKAPDVNRKFTRSDRILMVAILWLMGATYFFLFFASSFLWDALFYHNIAGYSDSVLFLPTKWAYYVFIKVWLLAALPIVIVEFIIGDLVLRNPENRIYRLFLLGVFTWLCGLFLFTFCCFAAAIPFTIGYVYKFSDPGVLVILTMLFFVIPPLVICLVALRLFPKGKHKYSKQIEE